MAMQPPPQQSVSSLWGLNGELYSPYGRLPDWSYAGYAAGETSLPLLQPTHNVRSYGACGDGATDDTPAFLAAIQAMSPHGGVLHIPAGRYIITQRLLFQHRISLKGDGSSYTTLVFPYSLADIYGDSAKQPKVWVPLPVRGEAARGDGPATYSFSKAFLNWQGEALVGSARLKLADVSSPANRGDTQLHVTNTQGFAVGEWVSVTMAACVDGPQRFLSMNLGVDPGGSDPFCASPTAFPFQSRVAAVSPETGSITLERPLPWDLHPEFQPWQVFRWAPQLSNIGVEGLTCEFPQNNPYRGHFKEPGHNAIELDRVANSFVRDIRIINADYGINLGSCAFVTVTGVTVSATPGRARPQEGDATGHHALTAASSVDCLVEHFSIETKFLHDLSLDRFARGVVFSQGQGLDLNCDNHRGQVYGNLFTCLHLGRGCRVYSSGGKATRGLNAGTFTTFWHLIAANSKAAGPNPSFGPALNFVGVPEGTAWPKLDNPVGRTWLIERIPGPALQPVNIFVAQRTLRLSQPGYVCAAMGGQGRGLAGGKRLDQY